MSLRVPTDQLYRRLADNSVRCVIDNILRADFVVLDELDFSPLDVVACPVNSFGIRSPCPEVLGGAPTS